MTNRTRTLERPRMPGGTGTRARVARVIPTGVERVLQDDEFIVSKTDAKGVIRYANEVFLRVSGYSEEEALGQPHSLIRHPESPRGIFRLLWETISSGQEMFAYLNNLAADGGHYWVLAHVTPSFGPGGRIIGYHSNRRRPERAAVTQMEDLYARMRRIEAQHARGLDAAAASVAYLDSVLTERGLSYDQFVWQVISGAKVGN